MTRYGLRMNAQRDEWRVWPLFMGLFEGNAGRVAVGTQEETQRGL